MRPRSSGGFGEKYLQAQVFWWSQRYVDAHHFEETRKAIIRSRVRSSDAHDEQKRIELRRIVDSEKVQNPNRGVDCKRWSARARGGTSVRSWLESVHNRATTRRNASCPVAGQVLQRSRIVVWVGQRSRAMSHPKREKFYLQDRQFCTSICHFRKQSVLYNPITRIVGTRGISRIWQQSGSKLIFRFSIRAKWRNELRETWAGILGKWQEGREWSVSKYAFLVRGFHR